MPKIVIEIPENEIKEAILNVVAENYYCDYSSDRRKVDRIVAECIREIIYKDKDRIVDLIVNRSERHLKKWDEEEDCMIVLEGWWEYRNFHPDDVYNCPVDEKVIAWQPIPKSYRPKEVK